MGVLVGRHDVQRPTVDAEVHGPFYSAAQIQQSLRQHRMEAIGPVLRALLA
jgi:hypothetical protein